MAQISEFTIVTYERSPGHWRAAFVPKRLPRNNVRGAVHSVVTPDDALTEADAHFSAERLIRKL
jgi:hypothetical protein